MKQWICVLLALAMFLTLTACTPERPPEEGTPGLNYLVLVNKLNKLPGDWEQKIETVTVKNSLGDDVEVEKASYDAYLQLKEALEKEGVKVDLDSARRSVADQQRIMDDFTREYGADYAAKTVAAPGFSEHHTGLALDLYLNINGEDVVENEDMIRYPEIWAEIHAKLAEYGFILRYLKDKEYITGYGYEPWHIRYVNDPAIAREITSRGITLEEYLGKVKESTVAVDYGVSEIFTKEELEEAAIQIKCKFASWEGCELKALRYAGDDKVTAEKLAEINGMKGSDPYTGVAVFAMEYLSPNDGEALEWWLGRNQEGGWEIVNWGR